MLTIIPPTLFGVGLFRDVSISIKILVVLVVCTAILDAMSYLSFLQGENNMLLFNIFTLLEFSLISAVYYFLYSSPFKRNLIITISGITFVCLILFTANTVAIEIDALARIVECVVLLVLATFHLVNLRRIESPPISGSNSYFLFSIGIVIYFLGTIMLYFFSDELMSSKLISLWTVHSLLNILLNVTYFWVIWTDSKLPKNRKKP